MEKRNSIHVDADLEAILWVEERPNINEAAVSLKLEKVVADFSITIVQEDRLRFAINTLDVGEMSVVDNNLGSFGLEVVGFFLKKLSVILRPIFNLYLRGKTVQVPTHLFDLFKLKDLTLTYHNNYVMAGASPEFMPLTGEGLEELAMLS